jgi:hypothetical protein
VLRCQAQLELTLMMCLGDRSTFTSIGMLSGRHDGSSPLFLEDLLSSRGVCVFARALVLSPPPPIFSIITMIHLVRRDKLASNFHPMEVTLIGWRIPL